MKILRRPQSSGKIAPAPAEYIARRRVEITVEREGLVASPPPSFEALCAVCGRRVVMLNAGSAALAAQVTIRTIYRWVDEGKLHYLESASGDLYLCAASVQSPVSPAEA